MGFFENNHVRTGRKPVKELNLADKGLLGEGDHEFSIYPNLGLTFENDVHSVQGLPLLDNTLTFFAVPQGCRRFECGSLLVGQPCKQSGLTQRLGRGRDVVKLLN